MCITTPQTSTPRTLTRRHTPTCWHKACTRREQEERTPLARARLHEAEPLLDCRDFPDKGLLLALLRWRAGRTSRSLGRVRALRGLVAHLIAIMAADRRHHRASFLALSLPYLLRGQLPLGMAFGARCARKGFKSRSRVTACPGEDGSRHRASEDHCQRASTGV